MRNLFLILLLSSALVVSAFASDSSSGKPWESASGGIESGILWQAGDNTPLSYRIIPTQISWRSAEVLGKTLANESRLTARHRFALLGNWIQQGPESYYVAVNGSPSVEWWNPDGTWSLFAGAGGGLGVTDSRNVEGGQGQDLTFHWFARGGIEGGISPNVSVTAGLMFLHMSNLGLTDPNPGIDAVGFTLGYTRRF